MCVRYNAFFFFSALSYTNYGRSLAVKLSTPTDSWPFSSKPHIILFFPKQIWRFKWRFSWRFNWQQIWRFKNSVSPLPHYCLQAKLQQASSAFKKSIGIRSASRPFQSYVFIRCSLKTHHVITATSAHAKGDAWLIIIEDTVYNFAPMISA